MFSEANGMELPRNMRQLRLRAGISVKKAAQASGFSDDAWYKLERGERWVGSEKRLHDIARALGVSAWQLLMPQSEQHDSQHRTPTGLSESASPVPETANAAGPTHTEASTPTGP
ncbi:MAG: hypothetical protein CMJ74_09675 [Planctomycetaceae bacterium]|nr:hypothetical protein [Planctomycetaceae bacterium]